MKLESRFSLFGALSKKRQRYLVFSDVKSLPFELKLLYYLPVWVLLKIDAKNALTNHECHIGSIVKGSN